MGGTILGIKDQSNNRIHLNTGGSLIYRASVAEFNGLPAFECDSTNAIYRTLAGPLLSNIYPLTVYTVFRAAAQGADATLWCEAHTGSASPRVQGFVSDSSTNRSRYYHGDGSHTAANKAGNSYITDNTAHIQTIERTGALTWNMYNSTWWDTGIVVAALDDVTPNVIAMGARVANGGTQEYLTGQIALIAAYSANNRTSIDPILQSLYGLCDGYFDDVVSWYWSFGDSKARNYGDHVITCGGFGWQGYLDASLTTATGVKWRTVKEGGWYGGYGVVQLAGVIDADIAAIPSEQSPSMAMITVGANDVASVPAQAVYEANLGYIMDAIHAAFGCDVGVALPWRRDYTAECATIAGYIANCISARSDWAFTGPNEATVIENGDDGTTYTDDGIHYNTAGDVLMAAQWLAALGY